MTAWLVSSAVGGVFGSALGGCEGGCDNNPITPACLGAEPCEAGKELVCGKTCTQPVAIGQVCLLDICADGGLCADHGVCVPVPGVGAGRGICESDPSVVKRFGETCNASASYEGVAYDECEGTFICNACVGREIPRCAIPMGEHGACSLSCANNNNGCDAGLRCIASGNPDDPDAGTCVRPCAQDSDCPCAGGEVSAGSCVDVVGSTMPMKVCRKQVERGQGCNDFSTCPTGLNCGITTDGYRCCEKLNEVCRSDNECCGVGRRCLPQADGSGMCGACVQLGQEGCGESADCCEAGRVCEGGRCKLPCVAGEACASEAGCLDFDGNLEVGVTSCDASTGEKRCSAREPSGIESCNGRNDRCDGFRDSDLVPTEQQFGDWSNEVGHSRDGQRCLPADWFRFSDGYESASDVYAAECLSGISRWGWVQWGRLECVDRQDLGVVGWRCVAQAGRDFCTAAYEWQTIPGTDFTCGGGKSASCEVFDCAPPLSCNPDGKCATNPKIGCDFNPCYTPADNNVTCP